MIADNFRCHLYCHKKAFTGEVTYYYIGTKTDAEVTEEVYKNAHSCIERLGILYIKSIEKFRLTKLAENEQIDILLDYTRGFIVGLEERFKEQVKVNEWGLMLVKDALVVSYVKNKNILNKINIKPEEIQPTEASSIGYSDGKSFIFRRTIK